MEKSANNNINNKYSIKSSPNYAQQVDEIELLKNIIPEKITILKEEPNFNIQIDIKPNNTEEPINQYILIIYLNCDYPEKQPRFTISEINNHLSDKKKDIIEKKLTQYCNENVGFPVIYQLYEICQEFADEEEKRAIYKKKEENIEVNPYTLSKLDKIKTIKETPIDIILLKNKNILIITKNNYIKIYEKNFESLLLEKFCDESYEHITFCKYFFSSSKKETDFLYLFNIKEVLVYEICYLFKKKIIENDNIKINGNIMINYVDKIESINDVIEFLHFKNSVFFISNEEKKLLLYKYDKIKNNEKTKLIFNKRKYIKNPDRKVYRKLYQINEDKFIIASYTLKIKRDNEYVIEGKNKMIFIDSNNFEMNKSYDIKISPLNYSISNYKKKFLIISYFNTINKMNDNPDNNFIHNISDLYNIVRKKKNHYYYEEDYYINDKYNDKYNTFYSYDIAEHLIGVFNINNEQLVTIIEFDPIKRMININDNLLCIMEISKNKKDVEQIANERMVNKYFNDVVDEGIDLSEYIRENYISFLLFDEGIRVYQDNIDYSEITSFLEVDKGYLVIGSIKKGIILYKRI